MTERTGTNSKATRAAKAAPHTATDPPPQPPDGAATRDPKGDTRAGGTATPAQARGPLAGLRVIEIAALGPAPFTAMMLADMGAEVLRVDRPASGASGPLFPPELDLMNRGRRSVTIDLKHDPGRALVLQLIERADVLLEGFRPGVMERLGLGPAVCLERNPRLVYGRMTGFGQRGPLAHAAGHDINYIALAGALEPLGPAGEKPVPPLNLLGDFGGGGMLLLCGVLAALYERAQSQRGQVIDAAMVDGSALLCTMLHALKHMGSWPAPRGENLLDGGAPFYAVYETKDHKYVAIGALEPQFYETLLECLGLDGDARFQAQLDRSMWPVMREGFAARFRERTRAEWCERLEGTDCCFAPVLSPEEAAAHPHNQARGTFASAYGTLVPAPAPRFSRTPSVLGGPPPIPGADTDGALADWGATPEQLAALRKEGIIG